MLDSAQTQLHRIVLEALPVAIWAVNRDGRVLLWTAGAEQMTGYLRQEILGRPFPDNLHQENNHQTAATISRFTPLQETLREGRSVVASLSLRTRSGQLLPVKLQTVVLRDDSGTVIGAAELCESSHPTEISERRQNRLIGYGCLDSATGLLNHSLIQARLKGCLDIYALYPIPFCVLCVTTDNLQKVRERYGQAAVDAIFLTVAQTVENALRPTDYVGRWLGQEFLVILNECSQADLPKIGERLCKAVRQVEVSWWGDILHATASIGATVVHDHDAASSMISRAESALRESSEAGGNRITIVSG
ncbi:MAG TPA: diguanylate cyclase [Dongiaceae bacterium]|nr:diguanylate cyclase [Dongiaceae bacterium]